MNKPNYLFISHKKSKLIKKMKNLVALLFMCVLSLAVLTSTAQDEKKGSKGKAKTEKKEKADKPEKKEKVEKTAKTEKKEKVEKPEKKEKVEKTEKVTKVDKKAADKDNTIKPAPKPVKNDDGKEADATTRKKVAGADKQIGKDEKGRTIFEGSRGGQYYINSNGNKTYLKADRKL